MSKNDEETWAAALGFVLVGLILVLKLAFWGVVIWGLIELILFLGRQ